MSIVSFDPSALVKLLVEEAESDLAAQPWDGCDAAVSSRLAHPDVCAAPAAAARDHRITEAGLRRAEHDWAAYWSAVRPVELTSAVERDAGQLAAAHGLRVADAVHLASALAVGPSDPVVAVCDHRLRAGVLAAGLAVAPG